MAYTYLLTISTGSGLSFNIEHRFHGGHRDDAVTGKDIKFHNISKKILIMSTMYIWAGILYLSNNMYLCVGWGKILPKKSLDWNIELDFF